MLLRWVVIHLYYPWPSYSFFHLPLIFLLHLSILDTKKQMGNLLEVILFFFHGGYSWKCTATTSTLAMWILVGVGVASHPASCMVHNQYLFVPLWRWKIKATPPGLPLISFSFETLQLQFSSAFSPPKHRFFLIPKSDTKFYNCSCFFGEIQLQWNIAEREGWDVK